MSQPIASQDRIRDRRGLRARASRILDDASIGRIEEWVVSTLADKTRPAIEADWRDSIAEFNLAKRPEPTLSVKASTAAAPATPGAWARFRLARRKGIAVVSLTDQALIKEEDLDELVGDLKALVEAGHLRIVLDFFAVERLSSWAARTINNAVLSCLETPGGAVKFSGLRPEISAIFAMTGLHPCVSVYPDTTTAVAALWPDLPDLRPLPVSILEALMRAEQARPTRQVSLNPGSTGRNVEDPVMIGVRLIVQDGPSMGRSVPIKATKFMIGRGPGSHLRVGSPLVSRSHASIERRGRRFFLRDLASTNGSSLNGRPVRNREVEIADGDQIQVGPLTFALSVGESFARFEGSPVEAWNRDDDPTGSTEEFHLEDLDTENCLKHEIVEGTLVVTPLIPELDEPEAVDAFRNGLLGLAASGLSRRVVVNLTHVNHLSGQAIGVLVAHQLRLDRSGGALRVCLANPRVALILEQVKLGMFIDYYPGVDEAVIAAWPEPATTLG